MHVPFFPSPAPWEENQKSPGKNFLVCPPFFCSYGQMRITDSMDRFVTCPGHLRRFKWFSRIPYRPILFYSRFSALFLEFPVFLNDQLHYENLWIRIVPDKINHVFVGCHWAHIVALRDVAEFDQFFAAQFKQ